MSEIAEKLDEVLRCRPPHTQDEVMAELRSDSPLNKARQKFNAACGRIEQAGQQRTSLSPVDMRRMEFEAVCDIIAAFARADQSGAA